MTNQKTWKIRNVLEIERRHKRHGIFSRLLSFNSIISNRTFGCSCLSRREQGQIEHALTSVLAEFRAGRNLAVAVGRYEKIDGCLHAKNDGNARSYRERVVAHVSTSRRSHIDGCRDDGRNYAARRNAHYHVLGDTQGARARACNSVCVGVGDLNGYRNRCGYS